MKKIIFLSFFFINFLKSCDNNFLETLTQYSKTKEIYFAITTNNLDYVKYLLKIYDDLLDTEICIDVDCNQIKFTPIYPALLKNVKLERIRPLLLAVKANKIDIIEAFLKSNVNLELHDEDGNTALLLAAKLGNAQIVKLLIKERANIHHINKLNQNVIDIADKSNLDLLSIDAGCDSSKYLVNKLFDLKLNHDAITACGLAMPHTHQRKIFSPLMDAILLDNVNIVKQEILKNLLSINTQDKHDDTALILASRSGNPEIIKLLLDAKANPEFYNLSGWNALRTAAYHGHENAVRLLLSHRAQVVNTVNNKKWTALHFAALKGHKNIVARLLAAKADADDRTDNNLTALDLAKSNNHAEIVRLIKLITEP